MRSHANAPLTPAGRRRLCERVDSGRPIAHVAAEAGVSRRCLAKWYSRWIDEGDDGLQDRTSRPKRSPAQTNTEIEQLIVTIRQTRKYGPATLFGRIAGTAKSVTIAGFSVELELESQLAQLEAAATRLSLAPGGAIAAEAEANVAHPLSLSADPVATIIDSYEQARHRAIDAIDTLTKLHGSLEGVPRKVADTKLTAMYGRAGTPTLADAMEWYSQNRGPVDQALALVTSELQNINDAVVKIDQPISAFSPQERVYATRYQAVAERVVQHFDLIAKQSATSGPADKSTD